MGTSEKFSLQLEVLKNKIITVIVNQIDKRIGFFNFHEENMVSLYDNVSVIKGIITKSSIIKIYIEDTYGGEFKSINDFPVTDLIFILEQLENKKYDFENLIS